MSEDRSLGEGELDGLARAEVLLVDRETPLRQQLARGLERGGGLVTATADVGRALSLARQKYFAAILVDLDTPEEGAGLRQLRPFREVSAASVVAVICERESFGAAVEAFRHGAADVISKAQPDELPPRLSTLIRGSKRADQRDRLLRDTLELHEEFLRRLMDAFRVSRQAEERAAGLLDADGPCVILVVDDDPRTAPGLAQALGEEGYRCLGALNGGEALDYAGAETFNLVLVNERLPDLPGTTVARSLRGQSGAGFVLQFTHPGQSPGHVHIVEAEHTVELVRELKTAAQLVETLKALHANQAARKKEKLYVQAFRQSHSDFLRKFAEVRSKLQELLPGKTR